MTFWHHPQHSSSGRDNDPSASEGVSPPNPRPSLRGKLRIPVRILLALLWLTTLGWTIWAAGALWFDWQYGGKFLAIAFLVAIAAILVRGPKATRNWRLGWSAPATLSLAITLWWFSLSPQPRGIVWKTEYARVPYVEWGPERKSFRVCNLRDFEWISESRFIPNWTSREYKFADLTAVDLYCVYWMGPAICHTIVSFEFSDQPPLCFSIEARQPRNRSYSTLASFYRQYQLTYVAGEERDIIRLRTNAREGEQVHLFRLNIPPETARIFLYEYLVAVNNLYHSPRWYNALTSNCTNTITQQLHYIPSSHPWDWRILLNGYVPQRMAEYGNIHTGGLTLPELMQANLVNPLALSANAESAQAFSNAIRKGTIPPAQAPPALPAPPNVSHASANHEATD